MLLRILLAPIERRGRDSVHESIDPELKRAAFELVRIAAEREGLKASDYAERVELRDEATDQDIVRVSMWLRSQLPADAQ